MNRLSKKRAEVILEEIIKPKDKLINELYPDNFFYATIIIKKCKPTINPNNANKNTIILLLFLY